MIVLDTHTVLWWASGERTRLSSAAQDVITRNLADGEIGVSSISAWEIGTLIAKKRLVLSMPVSDWLSAVASIERLRFIPVDNDIAVRSTELPGEFHKDPADRIIVATARRFNAPLVTADEKILSYEHVHTVW